MNEECAQLLLTVYEALKVASACRALAIDTGRLEWLAKDAVMVMTTLSTVALGQLDAIPGTAAA